MIHVCDVYTPVFKEETMISMFYVTKTKDFAAKDVSKNKKRLCQTNNPCIPMPQV
jgi:hypothetical protein